MKEELNSPAALEMSESSCVTFNVTLPVMQALALIPGTKSGFVAWHLGGGSCCGHKESSQPLGASPAVK